MTEHPLPQVFPSNFNALVVEKNEAGDILPVVRSISMSDLPEGNVTIKVAYSSLNYKDALACVTNGGIVKSYPFIPGIDAAGTVVASDDERYKVGQSVLLTGYEFGVSHSGGLSEYVRVSGDWLVPLPAGSSLRDAMAFGTAGLTAALSVERLVNHGLKPENGPILVTGASGGVGSLAVGILSKLGYEVVAATSKATFEPILKQLGAAQIISREQLLPEKQRPLNKQLWAGVIDVCGGDILASAIASVNYGGAVSASGLTAGTNLPTTVLPFILRGVTLYGIDSVYAPNAQRKMLWNRLLTDWSSIVHINGFVHEHKLQDVPALTTSMLQGASEGRRIIRLGK
ncbi:acryloyl-CoA reductase [Paenibacillus sp. SC116]|uniref:acrylyl-CoA reductase family protein n=1 Tax=Paenibacillus sp. SC116 TaxID=2968986 RepID=UPI00215B18B0|nr:acryloyl-CoA reductase [Paenibacillus sp. SC116]MCR8843413.1 acryloyl-CoA reductase [Paenibacillus sp. SC116]